MRPGYPRWRILLADPMKRIFLILIIGVLATSLSTADQSIIFPGDNPLIGFALPASAFAAVFATIFPHQQWRFPL
jgi:hypothetical protein